MKNISVYLESAPVGKNVVAHGLSKASPAILNAIRDKIENILIYPLGEGWFAKKDIELKIRDLSISLPKIFNIIYRLNKKYPILEMRIINNIPIWILAVILRKSKSKLILSFVGADIFTLIRTYRLSKLSKKKYSLYIVDDFLIPFKNRKKNSLNDRLIEEKVEKIVKDSQCVFVITSKLGSIIKKRYGVNCIVLPLVSDTQAYPNTSYKSQIIYLGSLNYLYYEGIKDLIYIVRKIRQENSDCQIKIRLTAPLSIATKILGELPDFVHSAPIEKENELANEIASSIYAFLPYTFDKKYRDMVETSFPSKAIDYLAFARSILVYGPSYSTTSICFKSSNLPTVISSIDELERFTINEIGSSKNYSNIYKSYLDQHHSLDLVREIILNGLNTSY